MYKTVKFLASRYWYLVFIWVSILTSLFIIYILPLVLPVTTLKDTKISGLILNNQVWEGKIEIVGDIIAFPNTEVVIKPGTEVIIRKNGDVNNFYIHPRMVKSGINIGERERDVAHGEPFWDENEKIQVRLARLTAVGTEDAFISVRSDDISGSRYDINLISIQSGALKYMRLSNYRRLEVGSQVIIERNDFSTTGECAICLDRGEQVIKNNTFKNGYNFYIVVGQSSVLIEDNTFLPGEGQGLLFSGDGSSTVRVKRNFFDIQGKNAIVVGSQQQGGYISDNLFNAGNIVLPCLSKVDIFNNIIKTQVMFKDSGTCKGVYTFGSNYWEILSSEQIINARIIGLQPNYQIKIPSFLKEPPSQVYQQKE